MYFECKQRDVARKLLLATLKYVIWSILQHKISERMLWSVCVCIACTDEATDGKWYSDYHDYDNGDGDDMIVKMEPDDEED